MKNVNSTQSNLAYQKQLLNTLNKIVSLRTELIKNSVILLNEGMDKEWPNVNSQVKYFRRNIEKSQDSNLKTISEILNGIEEPIRKLESNLELKNNFLQILEEQSLEIVTEKSE